MELRLQLVARLIEANGRQANIRLELTMTKQVLRYLQIQSWAALLFLLVVFPASGFAQNAPAKPTDPIVGIVEALKTHDVVALGEGRHGNEQSAAFRDRLYRDPRFQAAINDIVVESGNGRYQAMMDRYIAGEIVPEKELRKAWTETTQPHDVWDKDIYADMFRTIREINQKLPQAKQLRVLLGDTPYTWDPANARAPMNRSDDFTAELVQREVIAKKRKALMIFGDMHYLRRNQIPTTVASPLSRGTIVSLLEKAGVKVFAVWTSAPTEGQDLTALQPDIASWPQPSLALIKDTTLGRAPFVFYVPTGSGYIRYRGPDGPVTVDIADAIGGTMQEQADAILYLAPKSELTYAKLSESLCADPEHVEMRLARMGGDTFWSRCSERLNGLRSDTDHN